THILIDSPTNLIIGITRSNRHPQATPSSCNPSTHNQPDKEGNQPQLRSRATPISFSTTFPPRTDSQPQRRTHLRRDPPASQVPRREPQRSMPSVKHDAVLAAAVMEQRFGCAVNVV